MAGCFYGVVISSFVPYRKTIHYAPERNSYDFLCSKPEVLSLLVFLSPKQMNQQKRHIKAILEAMF